MGLEASTATSHFFCPLFLNHTATLYQADLYQVSEIKISDKRRYLTHKTCVSLLENRSWHQSLRVLFLLRWEVR